MSDLSESAESLVLDLLAEGERAGAILVVVRAKNVEPAKAWKTVREIMVAVGEPGFLPDQGKDEYSVDEVGLGRYRAEIPIAKKDKLTVRLRDPASNKIKVLHYLRPYPAEYGLLQTLSPEIETLDSFSAMAVAKDLKSENIRQPITHWFYLASLLAILGSILFRRI